MPWRAASEMARAEVISIGSVRRETARSYARVNGEPVVIEVEFVQGRVRGATPLPFAEDWSFRLKVSPAS